MDCIKAPSPPGYHGDPPTWDGDGTRGMWGECDAVVRGGTSSSAGGQEADGYTRCMGLDTRVAWGTMGQMD